MPVESPDWAIGYADSTRDLWTGEPKKWLNQMLKDARLARLVEEYRDLLLSKTNHRQRDAAAAAILGLE